MGKKEDNCFKTSRMESTIRGVTHLQKEEDWDPKNLINIRFFPQKISKL